MTCVCPGDLRIKFQPWETVQKEEREREERERERERKKRLPKYMGRVQGGQPGWSTRIGGTYVAVAASISCLLALVHTLRATAKKSVNIMMRQIFNALCPVTKYNTAEGPTSKPTVMRTRTRRTTISIRRLLYKWRLSWSVICSCLEDVKIIWRKVRLVPSLKVPNGNGISCNETLPS